MKKTDTQIEFIGKSNRILLHRQIAIELSYEALLSIKKLKDPDTMYGHELLMRLNSFAIEAATNLPQENNQSKRKEIMKKLDFLNEVREIIMYLIK